MTQTAQKTVYQYFVDGRDYRKGIHYSGCFKTEEEARNFKKRIKSDGASDISYSARHGVSPYGEWIRYFDVDAYFKKLEQWLGDYEITGSD